VYGCWQTDVNGFILIKKMLAKKAFNKKFVVFTFPGKLCRVIDVYFHYFANLFITKILEFGFPLRWKLTCVTRFYRIQADTLQPEFLNFPFSSFLVITKNKRDIRNDMTSVIDHLISAVENFTFRGSNWSVLGVLYSTLHISIWNPLLAGASCKTYSLPDALKHRKGVLNLKTLDNQCFAYGVAACLYNKRVKSRYRASVYKPFINKFNLEKITFPISLNQVVKFERLNNISVHILGWDSKRETAYVLQESKHHEFRKKAVLLLIMGKHNHFLPILSLSRFIGNTTTKHLGKKYFCYKCLSIFHSQNTLTLHLELCRTLKEQHTIFPVEYPYMEFTRWSACEKVLYTIYADFECSMRRIPDISTKNSKINELVTHILKCVVIKKFHAL
jgi:hypothetical protein